MKTNDDLRPLILDLGSNFFRLGWAGEDFPDVVAPSVYVNVSDYLFKSDDIEGLKEIYIKGDFQEYLMGADALKYQNILRVHEIKKEANFNIFMKFFLYFYTYHLSISSENQFKQPIIIIAPFFMSEIEKAKYKEMFIDTMNFPGVLFLSESQAILSTLQKTSGVIVNIGESNSYISSIFHGFTNIMAREVFPIAGTHLTDYMLNLILSNIKAGNAAYIDRLIAKEVKDKLSLCVMDADAEKKRIDEGLTKYNRTIDLPDGSNLELNAERFLVAEPIFDPRLIHIDYVGLPEAISKVIRTWDRENWEELLPNIIISGGGSLIPGLEERLENEIKKYFAEKISDKINVIAVSGRENMSWIGASILYSRDQLKKGWILHPSLNDSEMSEGPPD